MKTYDKPRQCVKKHRHHFADKGPYSQGYDLSSSHVRIWKPDNKEGRATKSWCFRTVVLEKTLENPLDCKEIKLVNSNGNQPWIFIGRTDAEAETPVLWPPDVIELTHQKRPWCCERLKAEGEEINRGWDSWMASPTQWTSITDSMDMSLSKLHEIVKDRGAWCSVVHVVTKKDTT